jgi:hypothetical protein
MRPVTSISQVVSPTLPIMEARRISARYSCWEEHGPDDESFSSCSQRAAAQTTSASGTGSRPARLSAASILVCPRQSNDTPHFNSRRPVPGITKRTQGLPTWSAKARKAKLIGLVPVRRVNPKLPAMPEGHSRSGQERRGNEQSNAHGLETPVGSRSSKRGQVGNCPTFPTRPPGLRRRRRWLCEPESRSESSCG